MSKIPEGLKAGDRVRVVIEDTVESVSLCRAPAGQRLDLTNAHDEECGMWVLESDPTLVSVEKLKPKPEVFKPGDRLRRKNWAAPYEITLASEGYLQHLPGGHVGYYTDDVPRDRFNSDCYEKLEFAPAPF